MALPELPPHNWLITDLDCFDYCGWDGCEKWAERNLFLTDEEFRRDVDLRNMQMIWGVFSAIPAEYSKDNICKYPLPELEDPRYMGNRIVPQHPLAFLELYAEDGHFTYVSSYDASVLRDVDLRNMQMIWGVFSAIPAEYSKDNICKYPLPELEDPRYMGNRIVPQHPLAFLELYAEDGHFTYVSSYDASVLEPLYHLPYKVRDEEADNKIMNAKLRRIQDTLRKEVPDVSPEVANEVQWKVWWALFKDKDDVVDDTTLHTRKEVPDVSPEVANEVQWKVWWALFKDKDDVVDDTTLHTTVMKEYRKQVLPGHNYRTTYWAPYTQE